MKQLSKTRKAIVSIAFVVGVSSLGYGIFFGVDWAVRAGKYSLFGFIVLFALLILPYWKSTPEMGQELVN